MARAIVDTNIVIRLLTNDIPPKAAQARSLLNKFSKNEVILSEAVVAEIVYVLGGKHGYGLTRSEVAEGVEKILMIKQFSYDRGLLPAALNVYRGSSLDFVDCLILATRQIGRVSQLLTFDKSLKRYTHI